MAAEFKDHFSTRSADYAAYRPVYPPELAGYLASVAPGRGLALDCGCGAGQLSTLLAEEFEAVVATDASTQQIANAKPHPRVSYRQAPAEASGLDAGTADLVTVAQAAHWFDLDAFYAEVRRVLKPGGVIALVSYGVTGMTGEAAEVLDQFYTVVLGPHWPRERRHVELGYRELPFPFAEEAPPAIMMTAHWTAAQLLGYVDTWSAVRGLEKAVGRAPYLEFAEALVSAWGDLEQRQEIFWPLSLRLGRV